MRLLFLTRFLTLVYADEAARLVVEVAESSEMLDDTPRPYVPSGPMSSHHVQG